MRSKNPGFAHSYAFSTHDESLAIPGVDPETNKNNRESQFASNLAGKQDQELRNHSSKLKFTKTALRMQRAADLAHAIAEADPEDARPLLTAALIDLHAGMPPSEAIAGASSAAKDWAAKAGEAELAAVAKAAATELEARSLHLDEGKGLLRTLFLAMDLHSRLRFLQWGKENCACD